MDAKADFIHPNYLLYGNERQQKAFAELKRIDLFKRLEEFEPVLTGTIPIDIAIEGSDLDIICYCQDHAYFSQSLKKYYAEMPEFEIVSKHINGIKTTIARFNGELFPIEIFGQAIPVKRQNAYLHMIIEYRILAKEGNDFREKIVALKQHGVKTEPAFAKLLGLKGDPYEALLHFFDE